jgi:hypothetical protein
MSHSKGPWTISDHTIYAADDFPIADLSDGAGPRYRVAGERRKVGPKSLAVLAANERLIVTAPLLLEALKMFREAAEIARDITLAPAARYADQVIAKAVGNDS